MATADERFPFYVCEDCGCHVAAGEECSCWFVDEEEYDGQPSMYEEYQPRYNGDDYDHGQFDCCDEW